jgi:hypothetical protein
MQVGRPDHDTGEGILSPPRMTHPKEQSGAMQDTKKPPAAKTGLAACVRRDFRATKPGYCFFQQQIDYIR